MDPCTEKLVSCLGVEPILRHGVAEFVPSKSDEGIVGADMIMTDEMGVSHLSCPFGTMLRSKSMFLIGLFDLLFPLIPSTGFAPEFVLVFEDSSEKTFALALGLVPALGLALDFGFPVDS